VEPAGGAALRVWFHRSADPPPLKAASSVLFLTLPHIGSTWVRPRRGSQVRSEDVGVIVASQPGVQRLTRGWAVRAQEQAAVASGRCPAPSAPDAPARDNPAREGRRQDPVWSPHAFTPQPGHPTLTDAEVLAGGSSLTSALLPAQTIGHDTRQGYSATISARSFWERGSVYRQRSRTGDVRQHAHQMDRLGGGAGDDDIGARIRLISPEDR
jgi:hypothetical protein